MYPSEAAAVSALQELGNGWVVLPNDDPARGVMGYVASRRLEGCFTEFLPADDDGPESHDFQWPIFGQALEPEIRIVSPRALIGFAREERENLFRCDEATQRQLGFVSYRDAAQGKAIVRRTLLTQMKTLTDDEREELLALRNRRGDSTSERLAAAALLSTAAQPEDDGA